MSPVPRIARNLLWLTFGDAVSRGGLFLYALLVARALGPERFGVFALAQSSALYVWIAVDLGVNLYGAREVAQAGAEWRDVVGELLGLRIAAGTVITALYVCATFLWAPDEAVWALTMSAGYLLASSLSLDWAAKGMERFHLTAMANAVSALLVLVGYFIVVRPNPMPTRAAGVWGAAYFGGSAVLYLGLGTRGRSIRPAMAPQAWLTHLKASVYFAASGALLSAIQYAPVLALTLRGEFDDLGHFSAAARLVTATMSAGFLIPMAVYPMLSRRAVSSDDGYLGSAASRLQWVMAGLGVLGGVALFALSGSIVSLVYGAQYEASVTALHILAWVVPLVFIRYSVGSVLLASGRQRQHSRSSFLGLVATAIGCAIAVGGSGFTGVSIAWLVGEAVVATLMGVVWSSTRRRTLRG